MYPRAIIYICICNTSILYVFHFIIATLDEYDNETTVSLNLTKCDKGVKHRSSNVFYGIMVSLLAALSFGSMFVPTKRFNTGNHCNYYY